jgi:adenine-specific DNA-methyltransferase
MINTKINTLVEIENEYIKEFCRKQLLSSLNKGSELFYEFNSSVNECFGNLAHNNFILILIYNHLRTCLSLNIVDFNFLLDTNYSHISEIMELKHTFSVRMIEELHVKYINSHLYFREGELCRTEKKIIVNQRGAVYTRKDIVKTIVSATFRNFKGNLDTLKVKILDFGCGTGPFFFEAAKQIISMGTKDKFDIYRNSLFAVDIDESALNILKLKLIIELLDYPVNDIKMALNNIICEDMIDPMTQELDLFSLQNSGSILNNNSIDIILSNPPYVNLKVNGNKSSRLMDSLVKTQKERTKELVIRIRKSNAYFLSTKGMVNLYRLSIERMLGLLKSGGVMGIICPSTLFGDLNSKDLRKHLLEYNKLHSIDYFPESKQLFNNVSQATVIFILTKSHRTDRIILNYNGNSSVVTLSMIREAYPNSLEIPFIDELGWKILTKISQIKKLKEFHYIRNRRGELDLTMFRKYITNTDTGYRLIRGNMIKKESIKINNGEFVKKDDFIQVKSKDYLKFDFKKIRLICQQISNVDSNRRLNFAICKRKDVIANSCNYISMTHYINKIETLKYILNSKLLNWFFKLTSTNNHINNYELDELPIIDIDQVELPLKNMARDEIEMHICKLYGLDSHEINYILNH